MISSLLPAMDRLRLVPITRTVSADLDTPLSAYLKLAQGPFSFLFESVQGGERWGRYSILGLPAREYLAVWRDRIEVVRNGEVVERLEGINPLAWLKEYFNRFEVAPCENLPRFSGGLVGYIGYEAIAYMEPRLKRVWQLPDELKTPDILLMQAEDIVVFDNLTGKVLLISHIEPQNPRARKEAEEKFDLWQERLHRGLSYPQEHPVSVRTTDICYRFPKEDFEAAVKKIRNYITAGDAMQVVLSQRLSLPFSGDPLSVYRRLRVLNPSPYMFFLDLGDFQIVGSSPEILVRLEKGEITVRPIAGTRPRGQTREEDLALERDLLSDPKELAEHVMLIDLGRNDVGRVADIGSVRVTEKMVIERYSHVMHIVSNVVGKLGRGFDAFDVLKATFPAGTVSGAPKIRAMEIIAELEPVKRGIYSGAVGYIGFEGNLDTAIAIRTAVIKGGKLHIQAGAGVVYDSVPEREWEETLNKGKALLKAVVE